MTTSAWCRLVISIVTVVVCSAARYPLRFTADHLHALIQVRLGTPAQNFSLIIDASTSDLVLFNDSVTCGSHCYDATKSSTFVPSDRLPITTTSPEFALEIDGATVNSSGSIAVGADVAGLDVDFDAQVAVMLANRVQIWRHSLPDTFQSFRGADGILGLAYAPLQHLLCLDPTDDVCTQFRRVARLDSGQRAVVALDLGANTPALTVGNISGEYESLIQWGSPNPYVKPFVHRFTVHDLTACGANLFGNYSFQWEAIIDTGASCLSLPAEFFDMVMAWIPSVQCDSEPMSCWVPVNSTSTLPKLTFNLGVDQRLLFLPLEQLLLPDRNGSARLCIYRDDPIVSSSLNLSPPISFGTLAMRAFYAALDFDTVRVGLANRISLNTSAPETCSSEIRCKGQQRRWIPMNRCLDPDCTGYLVRYFDPSTRTCALFLQSEIVIYVMVGSLFVAELALHAVYWLQCRKIVATVPTL